MHYGQAEVSEYLLSGATLETCKMVSLLAKSGFIIISISDNDSGVHLQSPSDDGNFITSATTLDNWETGSFSLRGADGTAIAHFEILWDEKYMQLVLAMIAQLLNECTIRLYEYTPIENLA